MEIAVVTEGIRPSVFAIVPWIRHREFLASQDIHIRVLAGDDESFSRPYDAMMLHVWQDWKNPRRFEPKKILPIMSRHSAYRAEYPETTQIALNHVDMSRRVFTFPIWRRDDPILYRTPPYAREELSPLPAKDIEPFEWVWTEADYVDNPTPKYAAGFIGRPSGPKGYRAQVAEETARVGVGICADRHPYTQDEHDALMADCRIAVCPRGWGGQSHRHWSAWLSGKPVLTDRECDAVEMIPGVRLQEGVHYLVFEDPREIPNIVSEWTRPSRREELSAIGENGRLAARSCDQASRLAEFFRRVVPRSTDKPRPSR